MNKRMQQLAAQALDRVVPYTWTRLDYDEIQKLQVCFAQLIVQECVAICQDLDGEDNTDAKSGRQDCAVEIQEHFGVEP